MNQDAGYKDKELKDLEKELEGLRNDLSEHKNVINQLEMDARDARLKNDSLEGKVDHLEADLGYKDKDLESCLSKLKDEIDKGNILANDLKSLENENGKLGGALKRSEADN